MRRIPYANAAATAALVLAAGGLAVAANPGQDGVIRGCLKQGSKVLRVPDQANCRDSERKLSWNEAGQRGAPGVPGLSGYRIVTGSAADAAGPTSSAQSTAECTEGRKAIGGGYTTAGAASGVGTVSSKPVGDDQWTAQTATGKPGAAYSLTAYAVCALVAPASGGSPGGS